MDDWFPLKLELIKFFSTVYLNNIATLSNEEKTEIERMVIDGVLK
jgi:hypothetical protein